MATTFDCNTVLDLSKKSGLHVQMKLESAKDSKKYESENSKDSVQTKLIAAHEHEQYKSSAFNTPPHESEISASKIAQNTYNVPSYYYNNINIDLLNNTYSEIVTEPQKTLHIDNRNNSGFYSFPATSTANNPQTPASAIPFNYPLPSLSVPKMYDVSIPTQTALINSNKSVNQNNSINQTSQINKTQQKKSSRPFKVYPNVPSFGNDEIDRILNELSEERYEEYRDRVLKTVERANIKGTNIKMRRENKNCTPTSTMQDKDEAYLEKRKKNNAAAKRSRDARKRKEDEIAIRAAYLENKVVSLTKLVQRLQKENMNLLHYRDLVQKFQLNMSTNFP